MMYHRRHLPFVFAVLLLILLTSTGAAEPDQAKAILDKTGVKGGVVVHVGCGDGRLTAALRAGEGFLVHGLDTDPANVERARGHIGGIGLQGWVSVSHFDGRHLPFINGLVNLVVVEAESGIPPEEILRILAPGGVACIRKGGQWEKAVKPIPAEIDEWTHFLHGASGNAVSQDSVVDSPFHIQWIGSPKYSRDHEMATSMDVMVSAGGRLFYIIDEGSRAMPRALPSRWYLVARDAFNGVVLWKRPMPIWRPANNGARKTQAADIWRRLVATADEVYVTTDVFGPVEALDPATGKTIRTYAGTEKTEEIIHENGILYLVATTTDLGGINRRKLAHERVEPDTKRLMAIRAATGEILWTREDGDTFGVHPMTLAAGGGRLFFQNTRDVLCLAMKTGEVVWRYARPSPYERYGHATPTLVVHKDVVLSADRTVKTKGRRNRAGGCELIALSAEKGKELWRCPCAENVSSGPDIFVAQGLVWVGEDYRRTVSDYNNGRDLHTGEIKRAFPPAENWPTMHHHRCYRDKATERFILVGRTGIEFRDLESGVLTTNHWVRGICQYGIMPCNGLVYSPPEQCGCYIESKLSGFHALAPKRTMPTASGGERLERGPAYGKVTPEAVATGDWPTYRADNSRSGCAGSELPLKLKPAWQTRLGGDLSSLVSAGGRVYVAGTKTNTVYCLDAATGEVAWSYQTGGCVDSPPSIDRGMAVFGCGDGWVYALRASDGKEAWRFRAAPADLRLVDNDRIASVWPVHGSVVIVGGAVHFAAGRSSYLDGGMMLYKLDLETGKALIEKRFSSRDPETGERVHLFTPFDGEVLPDRELPGLLPDVLSWDGTRFFMRSVPLSRDLDIQDKVYVPHLFSSVGFLEDSWWERTYWIYGSHFYSGARGHGYSMTLYPSGRILVFDEDTVYGYFDRQGIGIFGVPKDPPFIDLKTRVAEDKTVKKAEEAQGKKADLTGLDVFVWKHGIPQNPKEMNLTQGSAPFERVVRRIFKYEHTWTQEAPLYPHAMFVTEKAFVMAGPPLFNQAKGGRNVEVPTVDRFELEPLQKNALDTFEGRRGSDLLMVDKADGKRLARMELPSSPVFDGMIAAGGRIYLSLKDGSVLCLGRE